MLSPSRQLLKVHHLCFKWHVPLIVVSDMNRARTPLSILGCLLIRFNHSSWSSLCDLFHCVRSLSGTLSHLLRIRCCWRHLFFVSSASTTIQTILKSCVWKAFRYSVSLHHLSGGFFVFLHSLFFCAHLSVGWVRPIFSVSIVQVADPNDRAHYSIWWVQVCWDDADLRRSYATRIWYILRCKALSYRTSTNWWHC